MERESEQAKQQGIQTAISVGATILGAFLGRKSINVSTIGRATTAARGAGRVLKETQDVGRAKETVAAVDEAIAALDAQFKAEADALGASTDPLTEPLETLALKPDAAEHLGAAGGAGVGALLARPRRRGHAGLGVVAIRAGAGRFAPVSAAHIALAAVLRPHPRGVGCRRRGVGRSGRGQPGQEAARTRVSVHATLADCLGEQKRGRRSRGPICAPRARHARRTGCHRRARPLLSLPSRPDDSRGSTGN